ALPTDLMQAGERNLRMTVLRRAMEEAEALSAQCPSWIVHSIQFNAIAEQGRGMPGNVKHPSDARQVFTSVRATSAAGQRPTPAPAPALVLAAPAKHGINTNSARVLMTATVTLRWTTK